MKLYLVQHAKPKSEEEDPGRPLSVEGVEEAKKMASHLREKNISLDAIYHSPKLRAVQTAEILAEALKPKSVQEDNNLKPLDDPGIWYERLKAEDSDIMLVGHLPHLQRLTSLLLINDSDRPIVQFRQSGVVCLEKTDTGWVLNWALVPELL